MQSGVRPVGRCHLGSGLEDQSIPRSRPNWAVQDVGATQAIRSPGRCHLGRGLKGQRSIRSRPIASSLWCHAGTACAMLSGLSAGLRSGSYTSAVTHSRCSSTANLRATATTARFLAFFLPRAASASPQRLRSVSGPNGPRMYCAEPRTCHIFSDGLEGHFFLDAT